MLARFSERLDVTLLRDLRGLRELARRRGQAARRAAERMEPIQIVVDDPRHGRVRISGRIEPPQVHWGDLREIEFGLREPAP